MTTTRTRPSTLVEGIVTSFKRALRTPEGTSPPAALLWTDQDAQWRPLISKLKDEIPELFVLGTYDTATRTGPTIWLRCVVDRTVPEAPPDGSVPVFYLPGVSRQELRAGHDCRPAYLPLIELLFRGKAWHQENGKDWTVEAFLVSEEGLGLDLAKDALTKEAVLRALAVLVTTPLDGLRDRRIDAHDFDRLMVPDPVRDVLRWLASPDAFKADLDRGRWETFCQVCRSTLGVNPDDLDPSDVAHHLVEGHGRWEDVWQRFREAPRLYRGVATLLREADLSTGRLPFDEARLPRVNETSESDLRSALEQVSRMSHQQACAKVLALEREHGSRRSWVWSELGESPLANALVPLTRLATLTTVPTGGSTLDAAVSAYATDGWRCDRAALEALALPLPPGLSAVVAGVVTALYSPWLDSSARTFQTLATGHAVRLGEPTRPEPPGREACLLFVDGLRLDLAVALQEKLESRELRVQLTHRLAPTPTVTATAKPLASLAAAAVSGLTANDDFTPVITASQQPATVLRLRAEMSRGGIDVIDGNDLHSPTAPSTVGWNECGRLDELGHKLGTDLARQLDQELEAVADRVGALLECGWSRIRIVTDHGWLLLPGGFPKVDLPSSTTATKWARCACVRNNAHPDIPTFSWYWHDDVRIACPPGIGSFFAGTQYAHGGLSFQECVVPELIVERGAESVRASIADVTWRGMRLRVRVAPAAKGLQVDLRRNWKIGATSLAAAVKETDAAGEVSLVVADDKDEGASATIVVLDSTGTVVDRRPTTVGENS